MSCWNFGEGQCANKVGTLVKSSMMTHTGLQSRSVIVQVHKDVLTAPLYGVLTKPLSTRLQQTPFTIVLGLATTDAILCQL